MEGSTETCSNGGKALVNGVAETESATMASSSRDPNWVHPTIHIQTTLDTIRTLEQLLFQLKGFTQVPPSSDGRGLRRTSQCDKLWNELIYIRSAFGKIGGLRGSAVKAVTSLDKKVDSVVREIQGAASTGSLTADQVQESLRTLGGSIAELKSLLPLLPEEEAEASRTAKDEEAGKGLSFENKLPALYLGKKYDYGSLFSELLEGLGDRARQLLLFFAAFPVGEVVNKRVLKNWWYGEGLLGVSLDKAEETADEILEELMTKCLIEAKRKQCRVVGFRMQPFVHFAVVKAAVQAGFFAFDPKGNPTVELSRSSRGCLVTSQGAESSLDVLAKAEEADLDRLQTLFNINEQYPDFKLEFFLKLKNVKVLSLGQWQGGGGSYHIEVEGTEFLKGLKRMKGLRLLSLRGMSRVSDLPDVVCRLGNLMILDLKSCHNLEALPEGIGSLRRLIQLDISECYLLDEMPKGIALLTELQVLKGFLIVNNGDGSSSCAFNELVGLKKLNKLSVHANIKDFPGMEDFVVFQSFPQLKRLSISWGGRKASKGTAEPVQVDPNTAPNPPEMGTNQLPAIYEAHDEDAMAAAELDQINDLDVVATDSAAERAKQIVNSGGISEEPEPPTRGAREAESRRRATPDHGESEHVMDSNAAKREVEETAKTSEIIEDPHDAAEVHIVKETRDSMVEQELRSSSKLDAPERDGQDDVSILPKGRGDQVSPGRGMRQEGRSPGPLKRIPTKMFQKVARLASMNLRPEAENQTQEAELTLKVLEKLDLLCYPSETAPSWLKPKMMTKLKKLYVRGGKLCSLGEVHLDGSWTVEILRLKHLGELEMSWEDLLALFPKLVYLEKEDCKKLASFKCGENGLWLSRTGDHVSRE